MTRNKGGLGALLVAGAAAYGYYKYSKMSEQQKRDLVDRGKRFVNDNLGGIKDAWGKVAGGQNGQSASRHEADAPNGYNGANS